VISLAGGISITASDGETRHIGVGEIVLVEDTTGKGHITKSADVVYDPVGGDAFDQALRAVNWEARSW
jgi:NADPH:quinone reductase-like Zn-dependent oxidoreductase